jgi:NTP pyrophosphatase (non-canonical NTP hydrolase)
MEEQGLVEATEVGRTLMWTQTRKPQLGDIDHTVLGRALDKWDEEAQIFMAFEEMGELQTELSRLRRGRSDKEHVAEEIADVLIMVHQMALVCGTEAVSAALERKMKRLEMKIDRDE